MVHKEKKPERARKEFDNLLTELNALNNNTIFIQKINSALMKNDFPTTKILIPEFDNYVKNTNNQIANKFNILRKRINLILDDLNNSLLEQKKDKESKEVKKDYKAIQKELEKDKQFLTGKIQRIEDESKQHREEKKLLVDKCNQLKNQLENESNDFKNYGAFNLAKDLVPILDLFESSLNAKVTSDEMKNFLTGFKMVFGNLKEIFNAQGIKEIDVKPGDDFDHEIHEAIEAVEGKEFKENQIVEVLKKPYKMKEKVLRHGIVKVKK